ncbi:hypothetical protein [Lentzea terrae]|uniref:hypothetical protein n=1 Tax=Lentzea terrae TaxID=2200761 RepID=UPI000DD4A1B8|nr:hypothetical protein [Lentzea terrae]
MASDAEDDRTDMFAAIAVVVGIVLLAISLPAFPKAVKIASRTGTFTSEDGKITRAGVHVRNGLPRGLKVGERIRAFDIGTKDEVYTSEGQAGYPYALPFILGGVGTIALVLGAEHAWRNRKRP